MSWTRLVVVLIAISSVVAIGPKASAAQGPEVRSASGDRLLELFSGISPGSDVQIVTPTLFIEEASFQGLVGRDVELSQDGRTGTVSVDQIRTVAVKRSHALQGVLWGVGAGILVGTVSGMMIGSFGCTSELGCSQTEKEGALRWGIAVGLAGAVTGFLFGRRSVHWQPIFP